MLCDLDHSYGSARWGTPVLPPAPLEVTVDEAPKPHTLVGELGNSYFWVPIIGPLIGAVVGAGLYDALIGRHLPIADEDQEPGRTVTEPEPDQTAGRVDTPAPRTSHSAERRTGSHG